MNSPTRERARELRASMTDAEKIMWRLLHHGELSALNFRRQAPFDRYILDFVSHPARLVVEVDGVQHSEKEQREHDARRTAFIESRGYRVLRFWNHETKFQQDGVWRTVYCAALKTPARARMERWRAANAHTPYQNDAPNLPSMGRSAAERPGGVIGADGEAAGAGGAAAPSLPASASAPITPLDPKEVGGDEALAPLGSPSAPITPPGARYASADLPIEGRSGADAGKGEG